MSACTVPSSAVSSPRFGVSLARPPIAAGAAAVAAAGVAAVAVASTVAAAGACCAGHTSESTVIADHSGCIRPSHAL